MSGQAAQRFDSTPGRHADVGNVADAPSLNTNFYKPTATQYVNDGRSFGAIGDALGSFFNAGRQALETVDQVNHQQDLVQIERENQALARQAVSDEGRGKPMDSAYADRYAYAGTYQVAAADTHAFDLSESLRAHMAKQPLDGSVDLNDVARTYFKEQVGAGTGNPDYDARLVSQFSKAADQQIAQYQEASRATILQNSTAEIIQQFTQRVFAPGGITTPQFAELRERIGHTVRGDATMRDKILMAAIAGSVKNDGQGMSVLRALQDLGLDQSEPETYNRISGEVLKRTNAVKTFEAGEQVQRWQMDLALEKGKHEKGILPPDTVAEFAQRAFGIDSVHGVGMGQFPELYHEWNRGTAKAAAVNLWTAAFDGRYETRDSAKVAASFGKSASSVLSEHYDAAMSAKVAQVSPALAATRDGTGLVAPMKSDEAARDYARFVLTPGHRAASQDTISDTYKAEMGMPLLGRDAALMERSFSFYNSLKNGGLTRDQMHRYFPDEKAENTFWVMQTMSNGDRGIKQIAKDLVDRPFDAKEIADVSRSGHIDLVAVARRGGVVGRPEELDRKIIEARNAAMLDSADRKKWFGNAAVALDSNESAVFDALMLDQFQLHKRTRGSINLDEAVKAVARQTGKYIMVPGYDGALQAVRDKFNGAGRSMLHPLNEDPSHPLSVSKGYGPIYAPGVRVTNAMGQQEDLVVTWAEDAKAAHKAFPGMVPEHDKLYLEPPSTSGLSSVRKGTGEAIMFMPGQNVALGDVKGSVPTDPAEAAKFFRENLGPGWYAQQDGADGPKGRGYTLYYGARLKVGEKERDALMAQRQTSVMQFRSDTADMTGTSETGGGAAMRFPNATGSAGAATRANSDTTDNGPTWGEVGGAVKDAAGAVVDKHAEIKGKQIELAKDGWRLLGGSKRLDNAAGLFKKD